MNTTQSLEWHRHFLESQYQPRRDPNCVDDTNQEFEFVRFLNRNFLVVNVDNENRIWKITLSLIPPSNDPASQAGG